MEIEISETILAGKQRFKWPWDSLKEVGDYFIVRNESNIKNGRQSVHQRNKLGGALMFKGGVTPDGGFKVVKVL